MKRSKRMAESRGKVESGREYSMSEGVALLKDVASVKFDETVEVSMNLGVDPRQADQNIRGVVSLPYGTGKSVRVLVLTKGSKEQEAVEAGADYVGFDEYIAKIQDGWSDVDVIVATPDVMSQVGKLGKILGPRGLMPSPKSGTVTMNIAQAVKDIKTGKIDFRVDKKGILHAGLGKVSFDNEKIEENLRAFVQAVTKLKPVTAKGQYIKKIVISSSMGPGIKLNHQEILQNL